MKKKFRIILGLLAGLLAPGLAMAQQQKGDQNLAMGVGKFSTEMVYDLGDDMVRAIAVVGTLGYYNATITNRHYGPTIYLHFHQALSDQFSLGLGAAFEKATGDYEQRDQKVGSFIRNTYTVALEGKYLYLNEEDFRLYGLAGLGYSFNQQEIQKPAEWTDFLVEKHHFNGHISPVGVEVGRQLSGFAEAGFGYKGVLNLGLHYRF